MAHDCVYLRKKLFYEKVYLKNLLNFNINIPILRELTVISVTETIEKLQ